MQLILKMNETFLTALLSQNLRALGDQFNPLGHLILLNHEKGNLSCEVIIELKQLSNSISLPFLMKIYMFLHFSIDLLQHKNPLPCRGIESPEKSYIHEQQKDVLYFLKFTFMRTRIFSFFVK